MRVETQSGILSDALKGIKRAVSTKATLPVLRHVHIAAMRGTGATDRLSVTATNLELAIRATCEASVPIPGDALLPFSQFNEWIGMDDDRTAVTLASDNRHAVTMASVHHCKDGTAIRSRATLRGMDAEDFPAIPRASEARHMGAIRVSELVRILSETVPYAARERDRVSLSGVHLSTRAYDAEARGWLHACASDGVKASMTSADFDDTGAEAEARGSVTLPAASVKAMLPILKDCDADSIAILSTAARGQLLIDVAGVAIVSRALETDYPYSAMLAIFSAPAIATLQATREGLYGMMARALAMSDTKETFVTLRADRGEREYDTHTLYCDMTGAEASAGDNCDCSLWDDGDLPAQTYNVKLLAEAIKSYPGSHGTGKNKRPQYLTLAFTRDGVRVASNDAASRIHTLSGERVIGRVYTKIEQDRRAWQVAGARSSWSTVRDGEDTTLCYRLYNVPDDDRAQWIADSIAANVASKASAYAEKMAHIDAVMASAWEGYSDPPIVEDSAYSRAECDRALSKALAYYDGIASAPVCTALALASDNPAAILPALATRPYAPASTILLLPARSIVNKSIIPYGIPIAEDCSPAMAAAIWRAHCDARALATRVVSDGEASAYRHYWYGERLVLVHCAATCGDPEYIAIGRRGLDDVWRYSNPIATFPDALRALLATIPGRAENAPGMPIPDDCAPSQALALWQAHTRPRDMWRAFEDGSLAIAPDFIAAVRAEALRARENAARWYPAEDAPALAYASMFDRDTSQDGEQCASAPAYVASADDACGMFEWRALASDVATLAGARSSP